MLGSRTAVKQSYPRCRRARFKDGRVVEVLRSAHERMSRELRSQLDEVAANFWGRADVAGYSLVVWYAVTGDTATVTANKPSSPYAAMHIPTLVEGCVTRHSVNDT